MFGALTLQQSIFKLNHAELKSERISFGNHQKRGIIITKKAVSKLQAQNTFIETESILC